ncbi:SERB phosphatase, partial [Polyodon spathula]|nr:SERB phosphatase [Polyodon spathula]
MTTLLETKAIFRGADAVCFDVDSTVIKEEGIDELAKFCGVGDAVTEMTRKAMGGTMTFKTALTKRLAIIRPSREQVNKLITDHPPQLTEGIQELVERLQQHNVQVFLISGGFRSIVEHVATQLNIPLSHVFANRLKFYFNGEYAGFDETQLTAESGGKGKVISLLKEKYGLKKVVMIGDGATDMEACPPAVCILRENSILQMFCKFSLMLYFNLVAECFHWIWWECYEVASKRKLHVVRLQLSRASSRTGKDLRTEEKRSLFKIL